jgi:hypothetical protein
MEEIGIDYLNKSPLFKTLLRGDEIRYTDILKYFMNEYNCNLFHNDILSLDIDCEKINSEAIKVYREKHHTDIWIAKETRKKKGKKSKYEIPWMLIEIKFKSLPSQSQLKDYSVKFLEEYLKAYKINNENCKLKKPLSENKIEDFKQNCREKLKFYLITPLNDDRGKNYMEPVLIDSICDCKENQKDSCKKQIKLDLILEWQHIDYETIGKRINCFILTKPEVFENKDREIKDYSSKYYMDYANTLISFSKLMESIQSLFKSENEPMLNFFKNQDFNDYMLADLYSKIRAFHCALWLDESFKNGKNYVGRMQIEELMIQPDASIAINNSYSNNGGGLFEIVRRINGNLTFIMQYQNKEIRKGIIISKDSSAFSYDGWFNDEWQLETDKILGFRTKKLKKKSENYKDKERYNYYTIKKFDSIMYYSTFKLKTKKGKDDFSCRLSVSNILHIMKYIAVNDIPEIRSTAKKLKIYI